MRRVAASRVYTSEQEFVSNHIVELNGNVVVDCFPLHEELPMTEWLGGAIVMTRARIDASGLRNIVSIGDFYKEEGGTDTFAYHIPVFNLADCTFENKAIKQL